MKKYNDLTYHEKLACVSLYPEEALKDQSEYIRRDAYRALGYTPEALEDEDHEIRQEAKLYLKVKDIEDEKTTIVLNGITYKEV